jgi:dihydrofolate reductase
MRKIVVTEFMTLDGIIENPAWSMTYWNDDIARFKDAEMQASDCLLLGRITYDGFAGAWPESKDEGAEQMNGIRKYVVSTTLTKADWNNSVIIKNNVVEEITKLKQQDGKDILVGGSATLIQTLIQNNLVDQYNLLVYPVVLGTGKRLFQNGSTATLKLVRSENYNGVAALVYQTQ